MIAEAAIVRHAKEMYPREACGFIVKVGQIDLVIPATNIALDPEQDFLIPSNEVEWAEQHGEIVAIYHSHPDAEACFTDTDLAASSALEIPYVCVSYPNVAFAMHDPRGFCAGYEGRQFLHGVVDCYTLVRDYYARELQIKLGNYFREDDWWAKGGNMYLDNLAREKFVMVNDLRKNDLMFFRIRSRVPNHAAVYLGDGLILHHLYGKLSGIEPLGKFIRFHAFTARHESLC